MFELRFWKKGVNIRVAGRYSHVFSSFEDAWNFAQVFTSEAYLKGADEIDINNEFYSIFSDGTEDDDDYYERIMEDLDDADYYEHIIEDLDNWHSRLEEGEK